MAGAGRGPVSAGAADSGDMGCRPEGGVGAGRAGAPEGEEESHPTVPVVQ